MRVIEMLDTLLPSKCSIILLQMKTISTSMFLNNRLVMTEIAYVYAAEFKCNSTCERKRKVTKNRKVRDSAKVKGNFFRRKLAHTISPRSKHIFPIYTYMYSREAADQRQDFDYLSEGTVRTHDSHKTDFRTY